MNRIPWLPILGAVLGYYAARGSLPKKWRGPSASGLGIGVGSYLGHLAAVKLDLGGGLPIFNDPRLPAEAR